MNEKIEGLSKKFDENQNLFENIKENFGSNKKIGELCDSIIGIITGVPVVKKDKYNASLNQSSVNSNGNNSYIEVIL